MLCWSRALAIAAVAAGWLVAEQAAAQTARVQLPTTRVFRISTTVVAPDRGAAPLGGVRRANRGNARIGTPAPARAFGNRAFGANAAAGGASVSATLTDHREVDRALLAEAARRAGRTHDILGRPVATAPPLPAEARQRRSPLAPRVESLWRPRGAAPRL